MAVVSPCVDLGVAGVAHIIEEGQVIFAPRLQSKALIHYGWLALSRRKSLWLTGVYCWRDSKGHTHPLC